MNNENEYNALITQNNDLKDEISVLLKKQQNLEMQINSRNQEIAELNRVKVRQFRRFGLFAVIACILCSFVFHNMGVSSGYQDGNDAGYHTGYDEGYTVGSQDSYGDGYSAGREDGEKSGYDLGYSAGYATAERFGNQTGSGTVSSVDLTESFYIGNTNTYKFHRSNCSHLPNEENQVVLFSRDRAIDLGYEPCGICHP